MRNASHRSEFQALRRSLLHVIPLDGETPTAADLDNRDNSRLPPSQVPPQVGQGIGWARGIRLESRCEHGYFGGEMEGYSSRASYIQLRQSSTHFRCGEVVPDGEGKGPGTMPQHRYRI